MNIMIFDTETLGFCSQDLLNIGYRIVNIDIAQGTCSELVKRDFLDCNLWKGVKRLLAEKVVLVDDMPNILKNNFLPAEKIAKYETALKCKTISKNRIATIFKKMKADLEKYQVAYAYAYNCAFDIDKFKRTAIKYKLENPIENIPVFDIWAYAMNHICWNADYLEWARENQIITASGKFISTSVESVTKFLHKDLEFVEDHTALSDTQFELEILLKCVQFGCDITRPEVRGGFIPFDNIEENN